jgi:hypothetical protein
MTNAQLETLGRYAVMALLGAAIAAGLKLGAELPGSAPIEWREIASVFVLSFCGTLSTAVGASTLTRPGSEGIKAQVDALRADGVHRDDMVVLSRDDAAVAIAGNGSAEAAFSATQVQQLTDELIRRRDQPPPAPTDPLPPIPRYPSPPAEQPAAERG